MSRSYTGQTYGTASAQQASMSAVPVSAPPSVTATPAPGGSVAGLPPEPGAAGPLNRPSERPGEPVTAGLPIGPGPGLDAMGALSPVNPDIEDLVNLVPYLPTLELLASQPTASVATRNFVRRLRSAIPPEAYRASADRDA